MRKNDKYTPAWKGFLLLFLCLFLCGVDSCNDGGDDNTTTTTTVRNDGDNTTTTTTAENGAGKTTTTTITLNQVIDAHVHLTAILDQNTTDYDGAAQTAIATMNELGITRSIIMPTPFADDWPQTYDADPLAEVVANYPDHFLFVAGGGTLNIMIQQAVAGQDVSEAEFETAAQTILEKGALGFGELAAEHIVIGGTEPYLHAPPNHRLLKKLADIAAENNVLIDIHMEAVPEDMPIPPQFASPENPDTLQANIALFEELLDHNINAKIIWAHVGWDTTGKRTAALCSQLLRNHSNLYMSMKRTYASQQNSLVDSSGDIKQEWLEVFSEFSDRFITGSDQFYQSPGLDLNLPDGAESTLDVLARLPQNLAIKFSYENAKKLYNLE